VEPNAAISEHGKQMKKDAATGEASKSRHAADCETWPHRESIARRSRLTPKYQKCMTTIRRSRKYLLQRNCSPKQNARRFARLEERSAVSCALSVLL